jgi:hypothetical protein
VELNFHGVNRENVPHIFILFLYFGSHLHCTVCRVAACAGTVVHVCGCGVVVSVTSVKCVCKYNSSVVFRRTDGRTDGRFLTLEFNARAFLNRLPAHTLTYLTRLYRMALQTSPYVLCAKSFVLPSALVYHVKTEWLTRKLR